MTLEEALEKAEASLADRARKLMDEARSVERARCTRIAWQHWWRGGRAIATKFWSHESEPTK